MAKAQAKGDPALGAWFAREQAHDAAVAGKLRAVVPPAGRREAIVTGARMSGGGEGQTAERAPEGRVRRRPGGRRGRSRCGSRPPRPWRCG